MKKKEQKKPGRTTVDEDVEITKKKTKRRTKREKSAQRNDLKKRRQQSRYRLTPRGTAEPPTK